MHRNETMIVHSFEKDASALIHLGSVRQNRFVYKHNGIEDFARLDQIP